MLVKDYIENCLKFAKETKKWESLNPYSYYLICQIMKSKNLHHKNL